jgi:glycosyltransferase involved in cell wall biosynthesis
MRVLMLGPLGPPHVPDQALGLRERGIDVIVGGNAPPDLEDTVLADAGVPLAAAPAASRSTPWGMAATVRWLRRLIRDERPDVVQAHWVPGFGFAAAAAGAAPLTVTAWGSDVYRASLPMRKAGGYALRRADLVMADSQDLLDRCVELGATPDKTALVQWGVDLRTFSPPDEERAAIKERLGLGPGPLILSPRSLMPVYNIPVIVEAFAAVGQAIPDAQLVLKHMGAVRIELGEMPHAERVHLVGNVPYERMADYYRAADLCLSITSSDSSPRSVWEAMACGCPCVLSDLPWVDELVGPASAAATVPVDASAVAAVSIRVLEETGLARSLSEAGLGLVREHLDRAREMDRLAELLSGLARGR